MGEVISIGRRRRITASIRELRGMLREDPALRARTAAWLEGSLRDVDGETLEERARRRSADVGPIG